MHSYIHRFELLELLCVSNILCSLAVSLGALPLHSIPSSLSHPALALNMMGCVQSVGSFGVIWPTGAVGRRCGDKGSRDGGVWRKAGLVWGLGWRGQHAREKSIK